MEKKDLAPANIKETVDLDDLRRAIQGLRRKASEPFDLGYNSALDDLSEALGLGE